MADQHPQALKDRQRMSNDEILAAVMAVAADVALARRTLIETMAAAIRAGVPPEQVALAAMPSEPTYALIADTLEP